MTTIKTAVFAALLPLSLHATVSSAQSSVTLYGIVDDGLFWTSNQGALGANAGGRSAVQAQAGVWTGSQFRLDGKEDLGGGTKAIFSLNSRFNLNNGASQFSNAMFGQWAYVGLANDRLGTLTAGRELPVYNSMLLPYSPVFWLTGFAGAHPGDLDNLDTIYKTNNTVSYVSPKVHGLSLGAAYAFGGVAGSMNAGSAWSAALTYDAGKLGIGIGIERFNNANTSGGAWSPSSTAVAGTSQQGVSAVTNGFQTAAAQQRFAVLGNYDFTSALGIEFSYTNVQYIAGTQSAFRSTEVWNTFGTALHYKLNPYISVAAGYSYTRAARANNISDAARYQQVSFSQFYALSKRTGLYALEAWQHASGKTLAGNGAGIIDATASIGDAFNSSPSSNQNQLTAGLGIIHRF